MTTTLAKIKIAWNKFQTKISEIRRKQIFILNNFQEKLDKKKSERIKQKLNKL
jgi:hypothetical protein